MNTTPPLLHMHSISKYFPGVQALQDVSLRIEHGQIHAVVGENGAGKSTLMKILAGVYERDGGEIMFAGSSVRLQSPADALALGIGVVYQDLPLIPSLSVLANIFLGREETALLARLDERELRARYERLCQRVDIYIDPQARVRALSTGERQLVEILKVLNRKAQLIVLDEPTAALDETAKAALFRAIRMLRAQGTTFIFITHFIDDVFALADYVTVLKDGQAAGSFPIDQVTPAEVITLMVGHQVSAQRHPATDSTMRTDSPPLLEVHDLYTPDGLHGVSFTLAPGEILGLTGLLGSGLAAVTEALVGLGAQPMRGDIRIKGQVQTLRSPHAALRVGICLLPADRKGRGLVARFPVYQNASLSILPRFSPWQVLQNRQERRFGRQLMQRLDIRAAGEMQTVSELSGGNQQKVVLARLLSTDAHVFILHEPTQGVDIGAKSEIFRLIRELADTGKGVLFVSSEFKAIAEVSDRSLVMRTGRIVAEFSHADASEQRLMQAAALERG